MLDILDSDTFFHENVSMALQGCQCDRDVGVLLQRVDVQLVLFKLILFQVASLDTVEHKLSPLQIGRVGNEFVAGSSRAVNRDQNLLVGLNLVHNLLVRDGQRGEAVPTCAGVVLIVELCVVPSVEVEVLLVGQVRVVVHK